MKKQKTCVSKGVVRMNNEMVLRFVLATDQLLNDLGNLTGIENGNDKKREYRRILSEAQKMQRVCYDPYLFATKDIGSDKMEYTCLVCGKVIGGTTLGHVVNLTEDGLIEGDDALEYAVSQLKQYLVMEPALSEVEIREALRNDLIEFARQR